MQALGVIATILALALCATAQAAPMKCSGEQSACLAVCLRMLDPAQAANCTVVCRSRFNFCRATGCWDNGSSRYCGLLRQ